MEQAMDQFNQARNKMAGDLKAVIAGGQDLVKAAANVSSAGIAGVREKFDGKLSSARTSLIDASRPAVDKAKRAACAANGYVRGNPWTVIGIAVAVSVLIGFLAAKRLPINAGQGEN